MIALLSIPVCLAGGVIFSYFWYQVISNQRDYVETMFEVNNIARVRFGSKSRYEVASGRINGAEEMLYGWRDYFTAGSQLLKTNERDISVMYNPKASHFHYAGRNLRVLSLKEFKTARQRLLQWVAFGAASPVLWLAYTRFCRQIQL